MSIVLNRIAAPKYRMIGNLELLYAPYIEVNRIRKQAMKSDDIPVPTVNFDTTLADR